MNIYPRTEFEMTQEDLQKILDACKPVPMIMLQCGAPSSPQENANRAWRELGSRMGFDAMTVRPVEGKDDHFFTAIPSENETQRKERKVREAEESKQREITEMENEIRSLEQKLANLKERNYKIYD